MKIRTTKLKGLIVFEPQIFPDDRGLFYESFNQKWFETLKITDTFVQDNVSHSKKGVLRGMHFQIKEHAQAKFVHVLYGEVFDVAVDIRKDSPTYGQWHGELLSDTNHLFMYIPKGFAHGFLVTSDYAIFHYKCTNFFSKDHSGIINYADPDLNIFWPSNPTIINERDLHAPTLKEIENGLDK